MEEKLIVAVWARPKLRDVFVISVKKIIERPPIPIVHSSD